MRPDAVIPTRAGIGLKSEHYRDVLASRPDVGFFEIHAENYMGAGGPPHAYLTAIRDLYPISLHGVGLSIGGPEPLDKGHLQRLKALNDRYQPGLFSEHLAWSSHGGEYFSDLLPLPYDSETLATVCAHVDETQEHMGRQMLLENPASYMSLPDSTMSETEFIHSVCARTGCALLLDLNNVFVAAKNLGFDPWDYLRAFPLEHVREIHLAGHDAASIEDGEVLIDAHGAPVAGEVWRLYEAVVARLGPLPTLLERDNNVPSLDELVQEAALAETILNDWKRAA